VPFRDSLNTARQQNMAIEFEKDGRKKRSSSRKKRSRNISFYVALILCAGAVALTVAANRSDRGTRGEESGSGSSVSLPFDQIPPVDETLSEEWQINESVPEPDDVQPAAVTTTTSAAVTTTSPSRASVTEPAPLQTEEAVAAAAPLRFRMPTDGPVTSGFSGDELVFCSTMCDWRIHNGIDIGGNSGDEVKACAAGIVESFAPDMLYGNTAVIRHADDSVIYYSGLSDTQMVSTGLHVEAGDVIGYIGEVPCELQDGPHIHVTMIKDGKFIDPAPLLSGQ